MGKWTQVDQDAGYIEFIAAEIKVVGLKGLNAPVVCSKLREIAVRMRDEKVRNEDG